VKFPRNNSASYISRIGSHSEVLAFGVRRRRRVARLSKRRSRVSFYLLVNRPARSSRRIRRTTIGRWSRFQQSPCSTGQGSFLAIVLLEREGPCHLGQARSTKASPPYLSNCGRPKASRDGLPTNPNQPRRRISAFPLRPCRFLVGAVIRRCVRAWRSICGILLDVQELHLKNEGRTRGDVITGAFISVSEVRRNVEFPF
jgi:hypothetical protein